MYDLSDLDQDELELIALEGGDKLAAHKARADAAFQRGAFDDAHKWGDLVQAEVDEICIRLGIKG